MPFTFATASRIIFGPGVRSQLPALAAAFGGRVFLTTGVTRERHRELVGALEQQGLSITSFSVSGEPTVGLVVEAVRLCLAEGCQVVIGLGGGSALDTGKAVAALATNGGAVLDYLEVIGKGRPLTVPPLPFVAVPTTAGAGAEVTANAVLAAPEQRVKVSLRSPLLLARLALVDPELTYELPPAVTASTGLDALTQLIEPFTSVRANPLADALCREGMARAARALARAYRNGGDRAAREDMALVSLFGGLALANSGLGAAHGFASVIGGMFPAPHGALCAALLPHVIDVNVRALRERLPESAALHRYQEAACLLTGSPAATVNDGVAWVRDLCRELAIRPLAAYGVGPADLADIVAKSAVASSMKANPLPLTQAELEEIVQRASAAL